MRLPIRSLLAAVALALFAALASCSGGADTAATTTSSATGRSTTASTAATDPVTTAAALPKVAFPTRDEALDFIIGAWLANDPVGAQRIASADTVFQLFGQPYKGYAKYGCDTAEFDTSTCNYRNRSTGGYVSLYFEKGADGWVVDGVAITTDG